MTVVIALILGVTGYQIQKKISQSRDSIKIHDVTNPHAAKMDSIIGRQVESFSLLDINGKKRFLSEWKGKVVVINFWATWCAPCREEIPMFIELQEKYGTDGLQFIGIAPHTVKEVKDFIAELQFNYPALIADYQFVSLGKKLGNDMGVVPYTVMIDRKGKVAFTHKGILLKAEAEEIISTLL